MKLGLFLAVSAAAVVSSTIATAAQPGVLTQLTAKMSAEIAEGLRRSVNLLTTSHMQLIIEQDPASEPVSADEIA